MPAKRATYVVELLIFPSCFCCFVPLFLLFPLFPLPHLFWKVSFQWGVASSL